MQGIESSKSEEDPLAGLRKTLENITKGGDEGAVSRKRTMQMETKVAAETTWSSSDKEN
jgi:hypothetical protein